MARAGDQLPELGQQVDNEAGLLEDVRVDAAALLCQDPPPCPMEEKLHHLACCVVKSGRDARGWACIAPVPQTQCCLGWWDDAATLLCGDPPTRAMETKLHHLRSELPCAQGPSTLNLGERGATASGNPSLNVLQYFLCLR